MTTQATADLLAEVQALIHEREREGVLGLAELIGPAEWADLVPELERIVLDRLPEELRILHSRAPVYAFDEWAGRDGIPPGELEKILGWSGRIS